MSISVVIWDWNGTILDDLSVSLDAVNYILANRALPPMDRDTYYDCLDTPIIKFYQRALNREDVPFEEISFEFNDYYKKHIDEIGLTNGIKDIIYSLKKMGIPQMIISASHISYIESALSGFGLDGCFEKIIAAEDYNAGSKVDRAEAYLDLADIAKNGRIVVGDTLHDYDMAQRIGAECILLTTGHEGRQKLEKTGAKVLDKLTLEDILQCEDLK